MAGLGAGAGRQRGVGMWEMRGEPREHLTSKVLCWVALERAIELAPRLGEHANVERDAIREAIRAVRLLGITSRRSASRTRPLFLRSPHP
jgi:hypothetical protein